MRTVIFYIFISLIIISCKNKNNKKDTSNVSTTKVEKKKRVLFVTSNAHFYGDSNIESTNHFPEIVYAYDEFVKEGFAIDFISPNGGDIAVGYIYSSDSIIKKYLFDGEFMDKLENTKAPREINYKDYIAVYYSGGGSAMFTVPESNEIQNISINIYEKNKGIISAICHGTAGIANLKKSDSTYLVSDKKITGFPDLFEDKKAKYYKEFPFSIQERIAKNGGDFKYSKNGWDNYYLKDDRIVTGQDPSSSSVVARTVIQIINNQKTN